LFQDHRNLKNINETTQMNIGP